MRYLHHHEAHIVIIQVTFYREFIFARDHLEEKRFDLQAKTETGQNLTFNICYLT